MKIVENVEEVVKEINEEVVVEETVVKEPWYKKGWIRNSLIAVGGIAVGVIGKAVVDGFGSDSDEYEDEDNSYDTGTMELVACDEDDIEQDDSDVELLDKEE
jgi:hypothetical protein